MGVLCMCEAVLDCQLSLSTEGQHVLRCIGDAVVAWISNVDVMDSHVPLFIPLLRISHCHLDLHLFQNWHSSLMMIMFGQTILASDTLKAIHCILGFLFVPICAIVHK